MSSSAVIVVSSSRLTGTPPVTFGAERSFDTEPCVKWLNVGTDDAGDRIPAEVTYKPLALAMGCLTHRNNLLHEHTLLQQINFFTNTPLSS